jgi:hypothetical protein
MSAAADAPMLSMANPLSTMSAFSKLSVRLTVYEWDLRSVN